MQRLQLLHVSSRRVRVVLPPTSRRPSLTVSVLVVAQHAALACRSSSTCYPDARNPMGEAENKGVFRFLGNRLGAKSRVLPVTSPDDPKRDYYLNAGSHPDVVARVWDQLGKALPGSSRALVFGTPALVHRESGIVLAFALGTEYAIRLPHSIWRQGRPGRLRTVAKWAGCSSTDIERECGEGWIFGSYVADEISWCQEAFRDCDGMCNRED
jgi:hypothetical protein